MEIKSYSIRQTAVAIGQPIVPLCLHLWPVFVAYSGASGRDYSPSGNWNVCKHWRVCTSVRLHPMKGVARAYDGPDGAFWDLESCGMAAIPVEEA